MKTAGCIVRRDVACHGNSDWAVNPVMMGGTAQEEEGEEEGLQLEK